ncbi:S9 family peptidase [Kutzneria albida]|uniref:Beta-lactamase/prolyl oligopeptidase n=1 Tax=Kutzneria albida DSM 43870 TaxID=1449976 RepID=W5W4B5_9PSEU|nr:S9 family peptidase [Kutzneria albida]AHH95682.1 beta-lactamase/prolyl oligopeptidase [Kutzneria albida DSM 43870]
MSRRHELADFDLVELPADPTISPDGRQVVYVLRTTDTELDRDVSALWTVDVDGGPPRRLTNGPNDTSPRFSPDGGSVAFLRDSQLWLLPVHGGEPRAITALPLGAGTPVWSNDGSRIAFSAPVNTTGEQDSDPLVIDRLGYKTDGAGMLRGLRKHLHVVGLDGAEPQQLTSGDFHAGDPSWAPDDSALAFARAGGADTELTQESSAYVLRLDGSAPEPVASGLATVGAVTWGVRGLLLIGLVKVGPDNPVLALVDDQTRYLTTDLDRAVMPGGPGYPGALPRTRPDGEVLFCARDRGCTHLYGSGRKIVGTDTSQVNGLSLCAEGRFAVTIVSTPDSFGEVLLVDLDTGEQRRLTNHTEAVFPDVEPFRPEQRVFRISDGTEVHGWLLRDPDRSGPAPLLVDAHGGPHNSWSPTRDPVHAYHQLLVARGWAVLLLNPRGSDGYGNAFRTAAIGAWGEADENDFLEPIDQLVAEGVADADRLALTGYSYGGYLSCWLPTRTDRFRAVVAGGVVSDLVSMAGTSDAGYELCGIELGSQPWEQRERYARLSPINHVDRVNTPTLVLHGGSDERCPVGQAEQWFAALRARGVPTRLVLYPGGGHLFILNGRPSHRIDYSRRVIDWLTAHP